jgi:ABC-2 type transport system ATP-binding protein
MDAVVVENLVKRCGDVVALDGVSFSVAGGEVFGLLDPTGQGRPPPSRS